MGLKRSRPTANPATQENQLSWLTTFNDMITLLMVFFVLLFTMGSLDAKRFKHFQNALQSALGVLYEGQHAPVGLISHERKSIADSSQEALTDGQKQAAELRPLKDTQGLEAEYTPKGIQLTLKDNLIFHSGSAQLEPSGLPVLNKICRILKMFNRPIRVEGHTDDVPIATEQYPSNWELSTARAITVVKYFIDHGGIAPQRLSAAGYGASKPRVANDTDRHRAENRRVEIILETTRGSDHIGPHPSEQG